MPWGDYGCQTRFRSPRPSRCGPAPTETGRPVLSRRLRMRHASIGGASSPFFFIPASPVLAPSALHRIALKDANICIITV
jgi:hypothetical protein